MDTKGFPKIIAIVHPTARQRRALTSLHGASRIVPGVWFSGDHRPAIQIAEELIMLGVKNQSVHIYEILSGPKHGAVRHR